LKKGYIVHGIKRRSSLFNTDRIDHIYEDPHVENRHFKLHYGDLTDSMNLTSIIQDVQPDEIYNLAAMSHVAVSFETPEYTANADGLGTLRILEAVRLLGLSQKTKIYQASTSELYGLVQQVPQSEQTPFYPRSPYAVAKLYAYWITVNYREAYKMHASNGILFNHESPIRGETFVTRKITRALSRIALGMQKTVFMGNLSSKRDWGHAKDYVEAMYLILQQEQPDDYVIATGITTTIRDFIRMAAIEIGIEIEFIGEGADEKGYLVNINEPLFIEKVGRQYLEPLKARLSSVLSSHPLNSQLSTLNSQLSPLIAVDPTYFRPTEVDLLIGDPGKAMSKLGWKPHYDLQGLITNMMQSDIHLMKKDAWLREGGYRTLNYFE
jgi:GDPmannose 4,6-dehydratase